VFVISGEFPLPSPAAARDGKPWSKRMNHWKTVVSGRYPECSGELMNPKKMSAYLIQRDDGSVDLRIDDVSHQKFFMQVHWDHIEAMLLDITREWTDRMLDRHAATPAEKDDLKRYIMDAMLSDLRHVGSKPWLQEVLDFKKQEEGQSK
jgi:hypothetical protein